MLYHLGVDQGTTNTKVVLYNGRKIICTFTKKIPINFTKEGWVEQNANLMIENIIFCIKQIITISKININKINTIGIANQTETFVVWDKKSGKPIIPAISWQCKRSSKLLIKYKNNFNLKEINHKTGLNLDATFTATKILWLKINHPQIYKKIVNNKYLIGTVDTWIVWNLTKGKIYSTDATNASRTLLCDTKKISWDQSLIEQFQLKKIILPEIKKNYDDFGKVNKSYFGAEIDIKSTIGDQQASLFGNQCLNKGDLKITIGTGAFLWLNKGNKFFPKNNNGCLETLSWYFDKPVFASEGFVVMAGSLIDYFINNLNYAKDFVHFEKIANKAKKNNIFIIPSLLGLGTPWWSSKSNGSIYGLNSNTTHEDICLAVFESIGFQIKAALDALKKHSNINIKKISIDGKLSSSKLMRRILSSLICQDFYFSDNSDITAIGATLIASNNKFLSNMKKTKYLFSQNKMHDHLTNKYYVWNKLVNNSINT